MKYVWGETTAEERQGWRKRTLKMYYVNTTRNVLARVCCFSAGCRTAGKLLPFPFPFLFQLLHRISSISFMNYSIVLTTLFRLPKTSFDEFSSEQTEKSYSLGIVSNSSPNYNLLSVSSAKGWIIFWTGTLWSKLGSYLGEERNWPHSKHNFSCFSFWNLLHKSLMCFRWSSCISNFIPSQLCADKFFMRWFIRISLWAISWQRLSMDSASSKWLSHLQLHPCSVHQSTSSSPSVSSPFPTFHSHYHITFRILLQPLRDPSFVRIFCRVRFALTNSIRDANRWDILCDKKAGNYMDS